MMVNEMPNSVFVSFLIFLVNVFVASAGDTVSMMPERCKTAVPVKSSYTPLGTTWDLDGLQIYETANKSNRVIINFYDVFAFHENTKQFADILAVEGGYRVVMPDFLRGPIYDEKEGPPKDMNIIYQRINERGNWAKTVKADLMKVMDHYLKTENINSFGVYGFCWGGKMTEIAASEVKEMKVAALIHPFNIMTDEAEAVKSPMYLFPSKEDADLVPFYDILKKNLGEKNCGHRRFDDFHHGFAAARGNFSDPKNIAAVEEVITTVSKFFSNYI